MSRWGAETEQYGLGIILNSDNLCLICFLFVIVVVVVFAVSIVCLRESAASSLPALKLGGYNEVQVPVGPGAPAWEP